MAYIYEVWCGRRGQKPGLLITYTNNETAQRVRDHQEQLLNRDIDPQVNPWRVWVEKKKEGYDELERRRQRFQQRSDAEDRSRY